MRVALSVARPKTALPELSRNHRSELQHSAPDSFVGDVEPTLREQILHVALAQRKVQVEHPAGPRRSIRKERRIRITSVAVSIVAGSIVERCPAIRRIDRCVVAESVVGRSVVAIPVVPVWNASRQTRYLSNGYRQVFEHRRLRSAAVTRRIELPTPCPSIFGRTTYRN
jgi:hypothetical protein